MNETIILTLTQYDKKPYKRNVCLNCGKPYEFGSIKHRNHILQKIITYRCRAFEPGASSSYQILVRRKEYILQLQRWVQYYINTIIF